MTENKKETNEIVKELNKILDFKEVELPIQFTHDLEFKDLYAKKIAQAGEWYESKDAEGKTLSVTWVPKTTFLVCPQNRQLVLNDSININRIDVLEPISDEDAMELEQTFGGKVGIPKNTEHNTSDILTRMGVSRGTQKISKEVIIDSEI